MHSSDRIALSIQNEVALVELNRPEKHNALDLDMFRAIVETQKKLKAIRNLRAVVMTGSGVDFCTGLDVGSVMQDRSGMRKLIWKWVPWHTNLAQAVSVGWRRLPVPVFAAIHGRCWGGGLQIALGADFRIVHPGASLSVMEGKWGLVPDMGGTLALRELTGRDHAMWLAMSAEVIDADRALELGIATALSENPAATAREMATSLLDRSPDSVAATKKLYRKSWSGRSGTALARETWYQLRIITGQNQRIAVKRQLGEEKDYRASRRW
jgi:enoyl-CoA hydratase/carnithine racemase